MDRTTNVAVAFSRCMDYAMSIKQRLLKDVAVCVLRKYEKELMKCKGSDWQHHNYEGGLIVHTYNMTSIAINIAEYYASSNVGVSLDTVKFGALMHDIGKVFDYSDMPVDVTNEFEPKMHQELLGHAFEGTAYVERLLYSRSKPYDYDSRFLEHLVSQCCHCMMAHMSDSKQKMFEAVIIAEADKIDAYLEQTCLSDTQEKAKGIFKSAEGSFYRSILDS